VTDEWIAQLGAGNQPGQRIMGMNQVIVMQPVYGKKAQKSTQVLAAVAASVDEEHVDVDTSAAQRFHLLSWTKMPRAGSSGTGYMLVTTSTFINRSLAATFAKP